VANFSRLRPKRMIAVMPWWALSSAQVDILVQRPLDKTRQNSKSTGRGLRVCSSERTNALFAGRLLHSEKPAPSLEFIETTCRDPQGAPTLFIHGAFAGAWMWGESFLPHFGARGRFAAAVSLRGHGGSEGRSRSPTAGLADYLADVTRAISEFHEPPIIVAHSLGALLAQRLLGEVKIRALVMLAPLPPEGLLFLGPWLLATRPRTWLEMAKVTLGLSNSREGRKDGARHVVFANQFSPEEARRYAALMVAEGLRALMEAHLPYPVISAHFLRIPSLVIAGADDPLIGCVTTMRTAAYHAAQHISAGGVGHLMLIGPGADGTARRVLEWIEQNGL